MTLLSPFPASAAPIPRCVADAIGAGPTERDIAAIIANASSETTSLPTASGNPRFTASSHQTWRNMVYRADNVFDRDYRTAWVENRRGDGIGEWVAVEMDVGPNSVAVGIVVVPGFAKSSHMHRRNNQPSKLEIALSCDDATDMRCVAVLADRRVAQLFRFPTAVSLQGRCRLQLTIRAVRRGTHFRDTSIAEARLVTDAHRIASEPSRSQ